MKKLISLAALSLCIVFYAMNANAQITLSGSAGGTIDGTYATFTGPGALPNSGGGVFAALNANAQTGVENILISVTGNTAETGANSLNAGLWATILVTPSGGAWTISGSVAIPLINFNGADNVTINGLNVSGNSLTISNGSTSTTSGTCAIRFINGATGNKVTNCSILSSSQVTLGTAGGTIVFSTDVSTTNGNDNNEISNCNIGLQALHCLLNTYFP